MQLVVRIEVCVCVCVCVCLCVCVCVVRVASHLCFRAHWSPSHDGTGAKQDHVSVNRNQRKIGEIDFVNKLSIVFNHNNPLVRTIHNSLPRATVGERAAIVCKLESRCLARRGHGVDVFVGDDDTGNSLEFREVVLGKVSSHFSSSVP
jgi:hypothetical protein